MDKVTEFALAAAAVGISLTASLTLFGIWWRGYPEIEQSTPRRIMTSREDGIKWLFLACTLWCFTAVVHAVKILSVNLQPEHWMLTFIWVVLSLSNSLCFVLATANLDEIKADSSVPAMFIMRIRENPIRILGFLIIVATILRFLPPDGRYYTGFDVLVSFLTILLITWGFFKSFRKRNFPIVAWLTVPVFAIFMVAQLRVFLAIVAPTTPLLRQPALGAVLSVGSDGMVSLLFVALTFSWVHEKTEVRTAEVLELSIDSISGVRLREVKDPGI